MRASSVVLSAVLLAACTQLAEPTTPKPGPSLDVVARGDVLPLDHPPVEGVGGGSGGGGGGALTGGGAGATGGGTALAPSAGVQRLSVSQLSASLPVVLGGPTWRIGTANGFTARAATLGAADYLNVVDENVEEVSALHQKFMADAARDGCTRAANADAALTPDRRVLMRLVGLSDTVTTKPSAVDQNLRYLKLRFHGVKVADADTTSIATLRGVFTEAVSAAAGTSVPSQANVKEGWRAVCVALLTAPEYHLY